jgi:sugar lactone lactonase YvrE
MTSAGKITVIAGSGPEGFDSGKLAGDGGPATSARLNCPSGVAFNAGGDLFIADSLNNRIRMVDTNGVITTVAGSGATGLDEGGYGGDGGPATKATFEFPVGLALDSAGNLYVADHGNDVIRKIDSKGTITTVAGTGEGGYSGDGGQATKAELHGPYYLTFDRAGDLFFTEKENRLVREVDAHGDISTVAGGSPLAEPYGIALDRSGALFVSDDSANTITRIDRAGHARTIAGTGDAGYSGDGGIATAAELSSPFGLLEGSSGELFVADGGNGCVRVIDAKDTINSVVCGP